jgi:hypothetical protein
MDPIPSYGVDALPTVVNAKSIDHELTSFDQGKRVPHPLTPTCTNAGVQYLEIEADFDRNSATEPAGETASKRRVTDQKRGSGLRIDRSSLAGGEEVGEGRISDVDNGEIREFQAEIL